MQNPNNASSPTDQEQNEASGTKPNDLLKTAAVVTRAWALAQRYCCDHLANKRSGSKPLMGGTGKYKILNYRPSWKGKKPMKSRGG